MTPGVLAGIAGAIIGIFGGIVGTYYSAKKAPSIRRKVLIWLLFFAMLVVFSAYVGVMLIASETIQLILSVAFYGVLFPVVVLWLVRKYR
jgi:hypothetical protein